MSKLLAIRLALSHALSLSIAQLKMLKLHRKPWQIAKVFQLYRQNRCKSLLKRTWTIQIAFRTFSKLKWCRDLAIFRICRIICDVFKTRSVTCKISWEKAPPMAHLLQKNWLQSVNRSNFKFITYTKWAFKRPLEPRSNHHREDLWNQSRLCQCNSWTTQSLQCKSTAMLP